jgi:hypothetical protein
MSSIKKPQVVYRFKAKVMGGEWRYVVDSKGIPVSITTNKGRRSVLHIFRSRYPSTANSYELGETLIADPDWDATKNLADYKKQKQADQEKQIQNAWWQN